MANTYFQFKQFTIHQDRCAMKVTTDGCLFGAWAGKKVNSEKSTVKNVLDIGTGTGLLSFMCLQKNPELKIDAIEIDKDAYEQAKENIAASSWNNRIHIVHADVKNHVFDKRYDVIICNPPFYENELRSAKAAKNTAYHSSALTLKDLFSLTQKLLAEGGKFYFLLPYKRKEEIEKMISANSLFILETVLVKQSLQHNYFRIMITGGLQQKGNTKTREISIWDKEQHYTHEFIDLLKDYYLFL